MQRFVQTITIAFLAGLFTNAASAQGLIWSVPDEEGRWIRYEGTYTQLMRGAGTPDGDLTLNWTRHLTIKALQAEQATVDGQPVACRWIEIKNVTGPLKDGKLDAGPAGTRIYKVLVPVDALKGVRVEDDGTVRTANGVVAAHFPIVKGFRKIGNEPAATLDVSTLEFFPALTLLQNYRELKNAGEETLTVLEQQVPAVHWEGRTASEDAFTRTTNIGELWRTDSTQLVFGLARWQVTLEVEAKASTDARSQFQPLSTVTEAMAAAEAGTGAQSEIDAQ